MRSLKQADAQVSKLRAFKFLILSFLILVSSASRHSLAADPNQEDFLKLIRANSATVSFAAQPLAAGIDKRIAYQANLQLAPASLMKIPTSYAALRFLGRDYRYKVNLFLDREGDKNVLLVSANGTPDLVIEDLFLIARRVAALGTKIDELRILQQPSYFVKELGPEAYQAAVTSISVNYNTLSLQICPSEAGSYAKLASELPELPQRIQGKLISVKNPRQALQVDVRYIAAEKIWQTNVSGEVAAGSACFSVYKALPEASLAVAPIFANLLRQQGVSLSSFETKLEAAPVAEPVIGYELRPLSEVVWRMNRFSSNFIAQQLAFAFGSGTSNAIGGSGLNLLEKYLKNQFQSAEPIAMFDASGLNADNRVTADFLLDVLLDAARRPEISNEFMSSLVYEGQGTLRNRGFAEAGHNIRVKTGFINGVSGLAGYINTRSNIAWSFVILQNKVQNRDVALRWEEQLIREFFGRF